jgi:hypothetical protein
MIFNLRCFVLVSENIASIEGRMSGEKKLEQVSMFNYSCLAEARLETEFQGMSGAFLSTACTLQTMDGRGLLPQCKSNRYPPSIS